MIVPPERTINGFSLDTYLIHHLGFTDGYKQKIRGIDSSAISVSQNIADWLGYGGEQEDLPGSKLDYVWNKPTRSVNHFHNPLKHWTEAGLNNILSGQSSVLWSQNASQSIGGRWSWKDARDYFYAGLIYGTKAERERNFSNTFRAIGQLMHLIHDASVPEHTRNDAHVVPAYEAFVEKTRTKNSAHWGSLVGGLTPFDKSILNVPTVPLAPSPISRIIDTDLYNGQNPSDTVNSLMGLAEVSIPFLVEIR